MAYEILVNDIIRMMVVNDKHIYAVDIGLSHCRNIFFG